MDLHIFDWYKLYQVNIPNLKHIQVDKMEERQDNSVSKSKQHDHLRHDIDCMAHMEMVYMVLQLI